MYRFVFFRIPFMRGGYRVPACPFGDKPITHMSKYKVAEVVTDLAFAETQREIVVNGDTAVSIDNGAANYVYIAQTNSETIGVYANDRRPAYYWVDDLQFVGVAGNDTPAAVVTISPDVWLTDFFSGHPTVRGRMAQTTLQYLHLPRTPVIQPFYNIDNTIQIDALPARSATGNNYWAVGVFAVEGAGINTYAYPDRDYINVRLWVNLFSDAAKLKTTPKSGGQARTYNINCIKIYILPAAFVEYATGFSIFKKSDLATITIESAGGATSGDLYRPDYSNPSNGFIKTLSINFGVYADQFLGLNQKSFIVTPARFIELSATRGVKDGGSESYTTPAAIYVSMAGEGDDGIKLLLQTGEEFIDISDDYTADFAANSTAVQQAQQKQLIALQAITGVIGAIGGAAGGIASGNYFGAVQAIAGGVESIAGIGAARRQPPQMRGNGGVAAFARMTNTLLLAISLGNPSNLTEINATETEFGWIYDGSPYKIFLAPDLELDNFYRFDDVWIEYMTGGESAKNEIATALRNGVRFVAL